MIKFPEQMNGENGEETLFEEISEKVFQNSKQMWSLNCKQCIPLSKYNKDKCMLKQNKYFHTEEYMNLCTEYRINIF